MSRLSLTTLERYVLRQTMFSVAAAGAVIAAVVMLIDFVDLSKDVATRVDVNFMQIAGLTLMKSPSVLVVLLPFMFLFGTLGAFVNLNRRSELIAMRAAGVSAWRFILPAAGAAFVIGVLSVTVLTPLTSTLLKGYERARANLEGEVQTGPDEVWRRQGDGRTQIVIHGVREPVQGEVRLKDVSMFEFRINREGGMVFTRRIVAAQAKLQRGSWILTDVQEVTPGAQAARVESMSVATNLNPEEEIEQFASPDATSFWQLPGAIRMNEQAGLSASSYRLRFHQLLATPLLFAAMSILAAAFSLRLMRLGGLSVLATSGVALGFVFFFLNEFSGALGQSGLAPVFAAAWAPPVLALLSGLTLLFYTEDG